MVTTKSSVQLKIDLVRRLTTLQSKRQQSFNRVCIWHLFDRRDSKRLFDRRHTNPSIEYMLIDWLKRFDVWWLKDGRTKRCVSWVKILRLKILQSFDQGLRRIHFLQSKAFQSFENNIHVLAHISKQHSCNFPSPHAHSWKCHFPQPLCRNWARVRMRRSAIWFVAVAEVNARGRSQVFTSALGAKKREPKREPGPRNRESRPTKPWIGAWQPARERESRRSRKGDQSITVHRRWAEFETSWNSRHLG